MQRPASPKKTQVRMGAVQWQMREFTSVEEVLKLVAEAGDFNIAIGGGGDEQTFPGGELAEREAVAGYTERAEQAAAPPVLVQREVAVREHRYSAPRPDTGSSQDDTAISRPASTVRMAGSSGA